MGIKNVDIEKILKDETKIVCLAKESKDLNRSIMDITVEIVNYFYNESNFTIADLASIEEDTSDDMTKMLLKAVKLLGICGKFMEKLSVKFDDMELQTYSTVLRVDTLVDEIESLKTSTQLELVALKDLSDKIDRMATSEPKKKESNK